MCSVFLSGQACVFYVFLVFTFCHFNPFVCFVVLEDLNNNNNNEDLSEKTSHVSFGQGKNQKIWLVDHQSEPAECVCIAVHIQSLNCKIWIRDCDYKNNVYLFHGYEYAVAKKSGFPKCKLSMTEIYWTDQEKSDFVHKSMIYTTPTNNGIYSFLVFVSYLHLITSLLLLILFF